MGADHHHEHRRITDVRRGQSRAAVTATLAMSCLLAACGVEPRVDEVRVSITAPTLDGHRQLGVSAATPPHHADPDNVVVTTPRDPRPPEASDVVTIAAAEPAVSAQSGDAVVAVSSGAPLVSRPEDPTDVRSPAGSASSDDPAATVGAGSAMADAAGGDGARGDGAPIDRAPGSDVVLTDTAGLASPTVDSGSATASGRVDGAHNAVDEATDEHQATAWVAAAEVLPRAPTDSDRTAVMTAVHQAWSTEIAARRAPDDVSLWAAVSASRAGVERSRALSELADLATRGYWSLADPTNPNVLQVIQMEVASPPDNENEATVTDGFVVATVCIMTTDQLWGPGAVAGDSNGDHLASGDAVPINTAATRSVMRWGLERAGDVWVLSDAVVDWVEIVDVAAATQGCAQ